MAKTKTEDRDPAELRSAPDPRVLESTHLMTTFNLLIGICALIIIVLGRWLDLLFAIAAVGNVIIGLIQEYGAKRKLDAIALLHQDHIRVLRDGMIIQIHREQVVLDDVLELRRGDQTTRRCDGSSY
ncbi:hypothetical protein [Nesterenkonia ebinurensis]|uniref:hypothetical protein n=1 Tax=Nesterenkonia ebinurensis TaxID=2608252 RepID=UPI00168AEE40|nr:hypothetical protein [Nesterenkonia ebinurensis]